jgi:hypothetical protein
MLFLLTFRKWGHRFGIELFLAGFGVVFLIMRMRKDGLEEIGGEFYMESVFTPRFFWYPVQLVTSFSLFWLFFLRAILEPLDLLCLLSVKQTRSFLILIFWPL